MQAKAGLLQYWRYMLVGALAFAALHFVKNMGQRTLLRAVLGGPAELIMTAMNSARVSPRITSRTGKIASKNFKTEKFSADKDSLAFRFLLKGEKADATIRIWMVRRASGNWDVVKSDTSFTK